MWSPSPQPQSYLDDWVNQQWEAEGRLGDAYMHLLRAGELAQPFEDVWEAKARELGDELLFSDPGFIIQYGEAPRDADAYLAAVEHIEAMRAAGVFDEIRAFRLEGAGLPRPDVLRKQFDAKSGAGFLLGARRNMDLCLTGARLALAKGDIEGAIELYRDAAELADMGGADRSAVGHLVRMSIDAELREEVQLSATEYEMNSDQLRDLISLAGRPLGSTFERAMDGLSRATDVEDVRGDFTTGWGYRRSRKHWNRLLDSVAGVSMVSMWRSPPGFPEPGVLDKLDATDAPFDVWDFADTLTRIAESSVQDEIDRRGTVCALAIELYRVERGVLPDSLPVALESAGLDISIATDPAWDSNFEYRREASARRGYSLYAKGDGVDDGGVFSEFRRFEALSREPSGLDIDLTRVRAPFPEE